MKLRLRADIILDPTSPLMDVIKGFLVTNKDQFLKINGEETSSIVVEECRHDETPPQSCEKVFEWKQI